MSKFVTLALEPRFNDEYGEYANLPVFNAHGDVVGYTGGEVPETGNPCEFYVMDEEGFPVCHSASENAALRQQLTDVAESMGRIEERCARLRELVRRYVEYTSQDRCEGCVCKSRCNDGEVEECWQRTEIRKLARELGVEVDG